MFETTQQQTSLEYSNVKRNFHEVDKESKCILNVPDNVLLFSRKQRVGFGYHERFNNLHLVTIILCKGRTKLQVCWESRVDFKKLSNSWYFLLFFSWRYLVFNGYLGYSVLGSREIEQNRNFCRVLIVKQVVTCPDTITIVIPSHLIRFNASEDNAVVDLIFLSDMTKWYCNIVYLFG